MSTKELLLQADQAFAAGDNLAGLTKLRELSLSGLADAGSWNRLAVVEEQIGDWDAAGRAHQMCLKLAPQIPASYVYAGYWLEKSQKLDAAASAYSLAQEANPNSLHPSLDKSDNARLRADSGNRLLRKYLSDQHRDLFTGRNGSSHNSSRVKQAIWPRTHDKQFDYPITSFAPDLFYLPMLSHQPFYDPNQLAWCEEFAAQSAVVKNELEHALKQASIEKNLRPYLEEHSISRGPLQELAGSLQWSALDLFKDGQANRENCGLFPNTMKFLKELPLYGLDSEPFEIFFSFLKPGQQIAAHYGQSNHALTVHLPLSIPDSCYLEVAGQQRQWQEGELLIFDDSFLHSAHNNSEQLRIVLIFSIWHPDLSISEQLDIQSAFLHRRDWMLARVSKLGQLSS